MHCIMSMIEEVFTERQAEFITCILWLHAEITFLTFIVNI